VESELSLNQKKEGIVYKDKKITSLCVRVVQIMSQPAALDALRALNKYKAITFHFPDDCCWG